MRTCVIRKPGFLFRSKHLPNHPSPEEIPKQPQAAATRGPPLTALSLPRIRAAARRHATEPYIASTLAQTRLSFPKWTLWHLSRGLRGSQDLLPCANRAAGLCHTGASAAATRARWGRRQGRAGRATCPGSRDKQSLQPSMCIYRLDLNAKK